MALEGRVLEPPGTAADAGVLVPDAELDGHRLVAEVTGLLGKAGRLEAMAATCRRLVPGDASGALAQLVLDVAERRD